ncbi:CxxH/CxxC protein [Ammoniphilus oxalaticus]|uniref:CxxH/CxxC protein n=1 Tax=Ammoniphilus oxalaticus TaxID=66863 RepID=A0A419SGJ2_9BACL|nr:CxxH/CxxC protein [Ammoniphilus oxalaticus]RKD22900.1 CxxH/CxxC protein [Ammoniphilus oxalaticus]
MIICCGEHMDRAIDDFVDEYEDAPDIYKLTTTTFTAWTPPTCCEYCKQASVYLVI